MIFKGHLFIQYVIGIPSFVFFNALCMFEILACVCDQTATMILDDI